MSDEDSSNQASRDVALCKLIKAGHRFLDHTKDRRELQDMEKYRDLGHATYEAAAANSKHPRSPRSA
jgi:hypothetical protein